MAALNIRDLPDDLHAALKAAAAAARMPLREYVIIALRRSVPNPVFGIVRDSSAAYRPSLIVKTPKERRPK